MRLPERLNTALGHVIADVFSPFLFTKGTLTPPKNAHYKVIKLQPDPRGRPAKLDGNTLDIPAGGATTFKVKNSVEADSQTVYEARVYREQLPPKGHTPGLVVWEGQDRDKIVANLGPQADELDDPVLGKLNFIP